MAEPSGALGGAGEEEDHERTRLFARRPGGEPPPPPPGAGAGAGPPDPAAPPPPVFADRPEPALFAPAAPEEAPPGPEPESESEGPSGSVPEPEPEREPKLEPEPEAVGEPVTPPEPTAGSEPAPEAEPEPPASGGAIEPLADVRPTEGRDGRRRRGRRTRRRPTSNRGSASRWRGVGIPTRFTVVAVVGVLLAASMSVAATVAVSQATTLADRGVDLADARRHNAEAAAMLREVDLATRAGTAPVSTDEIVRRQAVSVARLDEALAGESDLAVEAADARRQGDAIIESLADTPAGEDPAPAVVDALDELLAARQQLESDLTAAEAATRDDLATTRSVAIAVAVALVALAAVLLPWLARALSRSVVAPLRDLGRSMRRFGDGDLRVRATEGGDEVGTLAKSFNLLADGAASRIRHLSADAERGTQLRVIAEALELSTDEEDVHRIVEHALAILVPGTPAELLVTEEEGTRLRRVAENPTIGPPSCPVPDAAGCVAIRRGQAVTFESPDTLNACPWLRDRPKGPCSATCVPASAGGHLLGVLHSTGPVGEPPGREPVEQMVTIVSQASTRIGALRTLESTRTLASTDTLTGLANRRTLETRLGDLIRTATPFVLAVADLDHFKSLNDTYGHELGDRALQVFATVLAQNVRGHDLVARFGGEEFVLVYPEMDLRRSMEVIDRIRVALARSVGEAGLPAFTASFGVTHSSVAGDVETIVRIADAGLLLAKEQGRDRVVYSDAEVAATVFDGPRDRGARRRAPSERPGPTSGATAGGAPGPPEGMTF